MAELVERFFEALSSREARHKEAHALADLAARLGEIRRRGMEAWPQIQLSDRDLAEGLARALGATKGVNVEAFLTRLWAEDFFLAVACGRGEGDAINAFEATHQQDISRLLSRFAGPLLPREDLLQALREKLFVARSGRAGKIDEYAGQGRLQNWFRVTASRTFIDMLRATRTQRQNEVVDLDRQMMELPDIADGLDDAFLKREYRAQFKAAFANAVLTLTSEQRNLLRQHLAFQVTIEQLGRVHKVHFSTISRRIQQARQQLLQTTREGLMETLRVERDEFDSIMHLIRSTLDLSLARVLEPALGVDVLRDEL